MIIPNFLGIRNTSPARSIPDNALVDAVDVDIDDTGVVSQRNGQALVKSLSLSTAYSTLDNTAYLITSGRLVRMLDDLTTIDLAASSATAFTDFDRVLFTNDGLRVEDDVVTDLKIPTPSIPPDVVLSAGSLPAGTYGITYTYRNAAGLEGGSAPITTIELDTPAGISPTALAGPNGYTVVFYLTEANGSVFYDAAGVQLDPSLVLAESFPESVDQLSYHQGRLYCAQSLPGGNSVIWFSKPYRPHLWDYAADFLIIQGRVEALASSPEALLIGTGSAIYAYSEGSLQQLASYGVPPGRAMVRSVEGKVYIHSKRGQCVALPFENLTSLKTSLAPGDQCSTALVDQDGISKLVVLNDGGGEAYNRRS